MDVSEAKRSFEQTDRLYEQYGKPLEAEHWGKYLAVHPDGRTILEDDYYILKDRAFDEFGMKFHVFKIGPRTAIRWTSFRRVSEEVNDYTRFPYLPVVVSLGGRPISVDALIDTGFNADMVVPGNVDLGPSASEVDLTLGNNSNIRVSRVLGYVQIGDFAPVPAEILSTGSLYVIGMGILRRYEVILDHGQRVIVNP